MLPIFPKIVSQRKKMNQELLNRMIGQKTGIFNGVDRHIVHEGMNTSIVRPDGEVDETDMKSHSGEITINIVPIDDFNVESMIKYFEDLAEQLAKSSSETFFESIAKGAESVGNVIDGKGKPFSVDLLLEVLEKIQIDFEPDGSWSLPTMVVSPDQYNKIKNMKELEENDPEITKKFDDLREKKRGEFRLREAGRRLAG